jgi:hypothetical protein
MTTIEGLFHENEATANECVGKFVLRIWLKKDLGRGQAIEFIAVSLWAVFWLAEQSEGGRQFILAGDNLGLNRYYGEGAMLFYKG